MEAHQLLSLKFLMSFWLILAVLAIMMPSMAKRLDIRIKVIKRFGREYFCGSFRLLGAIRINQDQLGSIRINQEQLRIAINGK